MKANGRRRLNRLAQKKIVDHLKSLGLVETAAAVQKSPPSILAELMAGLGIDPSVLGDTPMPSDHSNPPSAKLLIAQALAEKQKLEAPKLTPAQLAVQQAEDDLAAAEQAEDEARKAHNRVRARLRKATKEAGDNAANDPKVAEHTQALEQAKQDYKAAMLATERAKDDVVAAKFGLSEDMAPEDRDAYYASLSADDVDLVAKVANRKIADQVAEAMNAGGVPGISGKARDLSVYKHVDIPIHMGENVVVLPGRELDGGTAIVRRGSGDFLVLQRRWDGDDYHIVGAAYSKAHALKQANAVPIMDALTALPDDASPMARHAHGVKANVMLEVASSAIDGTATTPAAQQKIIDDGLAAAPAKIADSFGGGVVRADIYDGVKRHTKRVREKAAHEAGEKARAAALASGATKKQAEEAYEKARRAALGTPTRGGGTLPHFDHKPVPESLGATKHAQLTRSGIRAWGTETADDYEVIAQHNGDLTAWGFTTPSGKIKTSDISKLTADAKPMLFSVLNQQERSALTTYTGGSYQEINAAITGRDPKPHGNIKTVVSRLESGFDKFKENNKNMEVMTIMRGTRIPSGWTGSDEEYFDSAFKVGSRVEVGKVTSATTRESTAVSFMQYHPKQYMMVIRTRDGLPVKAISSYSSEDEVILPPGQQLRCVRVDKVGVHGAPTVYLVAEDLVAEANEKTVPAAA